MRKYILVDVLIFIAVSVYATIRAAIIDAGSWTNVDPVNNAGHFMTMKESVVYNIPLGISEGFAVAGIALLAYFVGRAIYKEIKRN